METALCAKHEITGYPTLKFFHDKYSEVVRYKSARDIQSLNNFIEEQLSNVQVLMIAIHLHVYLISLNVKRKLLRTLI